LTPVSSLMTAIGGFLTAVGGLMSSVGVPKNAIGNFLTAAVSSGTAALCATQLSVVFDCCWCSHACFRLSRDCCLIYHHSYRGLGTAASCITPQLFRGFMAVVGSLMPAVGGIETRPRVPPLLSLVS